MLDMDEVQREIARLENGETTYTAVERLALLYVVRDHSEGEPRTGGYAYASEPQSEFIAAFQSVPMEKALQVMDEHMDAIKLLYPKEYAAVLRKILE